MKCRPLTDSERKKGRDIVRVTDDKVNAAVHGYQIHLFFVSDLLEINLDRNCRELLFLILINQRITWTEFRIELKKKDTRLTMHLGLDVRTR